MKKLNLFLSYRKIIKSIKFDLDQKFNIRIDNAMRMYTVINVPEDLVGEAYSLKKSDIDRISENYIKGFTSELSTLLNSKGLQELFKIYEIKKVDKYSYLVVIGFSLFKSQRYYNTIYYIVTPIILLTSIIISTILLF
jgi:hypothetical protein